VDKGKQNQTLLLIAAGVFTVGVFSAQLAARSAHRSATLAQMSTDPKTDIAVSPSVAMPTVDTATLSYTVAEDKSDGDAFRQRIIVAPGVSHASLEALLRSLLPSAMRGVVWAYFDQAHIAEGGSWLGMIINTDGTPELTIEDSRIAALTAPKVEKFGMSEDARHALFDQMVAGEDRAQKIADTKYSTDMDVVSPEQAQANVVLNSRLNHELTDQEHAAFAKKAGISGEQLTLIAVEAQQKNWAIAPPTP